MSERDGSCWRKQAYLYIDPEYGVRGMVAFRAPKGERAACPTTVLLSRAEWKDMGEPDEITTELRTGHRSFHK